MKFWPQVIAETSDAEHRSQRTRDTVQGHSRAADSRVQELVKGVTGSSSLAKAQQTVQLARNVLERTQRPPAPFQPLQTCGPLSRHDSQLITNLTSSSDAGPNDAAALPTAPPTAPPVPSIDLTSRTLLIKLPDEAIDSAYKDIRSNHHRRTGKALFTTGRSLSNRITAYVLQQQAQKLVSVHGLANRRGRDGNKLKPLKNEGSMRLSKLCRSQRPRLPHTKAVHVDVVPNLNCFVRNTK